MSARILIVDDDPLIRLSLSDRLQALRYRVFEAESCSKAREILKRHELDLILLDLQLPDGDGLTMLDEISRSGESMEVIMITAHGSIEKAVEAMRRGAQDFLQKPFELTDMETRIKKTLDYRQLKRDTVSIQVGQTEAFMRGGVVGTSKQMKKCLEECRRLSQTDTTAFLTGETGTGKEVLSYLIHTNSQRTARSFVTVSCANFNEQLIDDELFGHEAGAFTGASKLRIGKVELADGGTLFLDEIGELPFEVQAKLLRFLEARTYTRVGGNKEREADVRIIAATNRDLQSEIHKGRFREDLFYRINVFQVQIPPLRDRQEDVPDLIDHFLSQMAVRRSCQFTISPEALDGLSRYHWPGNVRELRNVIERATVITTDGLIKVSDLPPLFPTHATPIAVAGSYQEQLSQYRRQILLTALKNSGNNRTEAARRLGLHRTDFVRKLRNLGKEGRAVLKNTRRMSDNVK